LSAAELRRLLGGYQISQAIHVAAVLGIADLLAEGPRTSGALAEATASDPDALYRLLRALAAVGVFEERDGKQFALTALGAPLRADAPDSIAAWAAFIGRPYYRDAWSALPDSVRTGENAFLLAHGKRVWEYRATRPDEGAIFDRAMAANSRLVTRSLIDAYDFGRFETIVDVGGGTGALLAALLAEYPRLRGILFDQPHVVSGVDLGPRAEVVAGSFFDAVPAGGDAYLLKWIIHDWEDEEAAAILRTIRRRDAPVLVVERVVGPPNEDAEAKFSDLNMLVGPGGRERTLEEFRVLFDAAGFALVADVPTEGAMHVLEAAPVSQ
jgi:O-methyltransferase/methyltransferase family protein